MEGTSPMIRKLLFLVILALFTHPLLAQTVAEKKDPAEEKARLQKEAVEFLRDTMSDVSNMRSLENRISFASEMAGLMWFHDEREARSMFASVVSDFKELLMRYDQQMNSLGPAADGEEPYYGGPLADMPDRTRMMRKFSTAMAVRQQIAMSIAEHDAEMGFSFYNDSLNVISNPEARKQMEDRDGYFQYQLMAQIAETNAAKSAQFATKSLEKGLHYQHVELLKKIYNKDPEKGSEFAAALLSRAKTEKIDSSDLQILHSLLDYGAENYEAAKKPEGKKAVYSQQDLRDLSEVFAQAILQQDSVESYSVEHYADDIEKFSPSRAVQIRAKFKRRNANSNSMYYGSNSAYAAATAANAAGNAVNAAANNGRSKERMEREEAERKLMEDVANIGTGELPKEQREKVIVEARKILMQTPSREKKIGGLSMLAAQVAKAGDKELAASIMRDAQGLLNPQPKNYQDFILTWMLAAGYAEADPEKAFPLLEETIYRANDTISAFVKVGEFIDVAEEMIQDGEVQVGAFGGQMVRGMTKELGVADATIRSLVKADFKKTTDLTAKFDRPEVRILAKMMVLRAVLGDKGDKRPEDILVETVPTMPVN